VERSGTLGTRKQNAPRSEGAEEPAEALIMENSLGISRVTITTWEVALVSFAPSERRACDLSTQGSAALHPGLSSLEPSALKFLLGARGSPQSNNSSLSFPFVVPKSNSEVRLG
jgi:hypothetical protein